MAFHRQADSGPLIQAYGTLTDIQVAAVRWSGNREL